MRYLIGLMIAGTCGLGSAAAVEYTVTENGEEIRIETPQLQAAIRKKGYVTGVARQSLVDKKTGAKDLGFGLDIADWIMESGSDEAYRDQLKAAGNEELIYEFGTPYHGKTQKRAIEGPQICTQAKELKPEIIRGPDFVAIRQSYQYHTAAPGKKTGSKWTQILVFPVGQRYFVSMQKIDMVNDSDGAFLRIDMPGHIQHKNGDTFSEIYLSYRGNIPSSEFAVNFAPDEKFNYTRGRDPVPERFIRAYHIRNPETQQDGPWLAGMTLDAEVVSEAWCHQRNYVCLIEEFGGRPIKAGESFSAAFIVGYFDSLDEMHNTYDAHRGHRDLAVSPERWELLK
ncbi:hypothetical protein GC163_07530 [bacterium]|nr:hypothetical protein [bacterium]